MRDIAMEYMVITFLISVFLFFTFLYLLQLLKPRKLNLPPSPPKLPLIGNLHQIGTLRHRSLRALSTKYGPLMLLHFGKVPTVIVSSADMVKEITKAHQDVKFSGRPQTRASQTLFNGCTDIAFSSYGEYWRQVRKICVHQLLSQKRVQEFHFVREEEVAKMVEKIRVSSQNEVTVDLSQILLTVSNNIVSRSALGRVCEEDGGDKSLGGLARKAMELLVAFSFQDLFPSLGWIDHFTGLTKSLRDTSKALKEVLDQVIEEHQVSMNDYNSDKKDIVDILLSLQKNGMLDIDLTREKLQAILMDMIVGGTDTVSATMEWAMAELVRNPSIMKKAQEEVRKTVGSKSKVTEADVNEMAYLKCVLKETLRYHAPAIALRETCADVTVDGYDIPAKTKVLINTWAVQRDPKIWEKPEEFIPERFVEMPMDYKDQNGKFIPFGGGRRVCPGMNFALVEAEFVLANLLYWFDWTLPDGQNAEDLDMSEANSTVVYKKASLLLLPNMYSP